MNITERIKKVREHYAGGNNEKFAEIIGEKPNTVSNWANRGPGNISVLIKLSDTFPDLNLNWLIAERGEMLISNSEVNKLKDECLELHRLNFELNKENKQLRADLERLQQEAQVQSSGKKGVKSA